MLGKIKSLLGIGDEITRAARGPDRAGFATLFVKSSVRFLSLPDRFAAGLPANASHDEILAQLEDAAKVLSESEQFTPFWYKDGERRRMPLFSSEDLATEFTKWYALHTRRIIPFQLLGAEGAAIAPGFKDCDFVVLNDRTRHEYVLSSEDTALINRICGLTTACT